MKVTKLQNSPYDANAYLVDGRILVDAGDDASGIIYRLKNLIKPGELEIIILTHCHYDHSGGAPQVAAAFGGKIAIHRDDAPLLNDPRGNASGLFGARAPPIVPDIILEGGEKFGELEIIHTPGHTPGGICLYGARAKALFSGDTVFPGGSFGRTDLPGGNAHELVDSIRKLTLLDVSIMYPGHEDVVSLGANDQIRLSLMMAKQYS